MNNTQLDLNLLENYRSNLGTEVLMKMLALYRQQGEIYLADIEKALSHNEPQQWQEHCHKMKGASGSVGLKQVHALLVDMEKLQAEQAIKSKNLQALQRLNKVAIAEFEQWLTNNN